MSINSSYCYSNGYKILCVKSAKATAMGEAFIAQADNPSAVTFNPAGLPQLDGTQVSLESLITNSWVEHTSPNGEKEHNLDEWQTIPSVFASSDLGTENIAAGIGITVPNGLSSKWSMKGFARYFVTYSELTVVDVNPSLAWKISDNLYIGGGLSYYYSTTVSEALGDYGNLVGLPGRLDGNCRSEAKGYGWGYNAGVLCKLNERHSFAGTFKSPFKIKYKGRIRLSDVPAFMGLGSYFESDLETAMKFPAVAVIGYAYRPTDRLKLEFDLDWTRWEAIDYITVDYANPLLTDVTYEYEYENTFAYKFGLEYLLTDRLELRAGYIYNENAVPERNWGPSLPDTDTHFLCSGFGWQIGKFAIDGAIQVILYEDRTIDNNVNGNETTTSSSIDGKYENFAMGFSLGVTYKF